MIRLLQAVGLAAVICVAAKPDRVAPRNYVDLDVLRAVVVNRLYGSREYALRVIVPVFHEQGRQSRGALRRQSCKPLLRDPILMNDQARAKLQGIANLSNDRLLQQFREWLAEAEKSGIGSLEEFAQSLRGYALQPGWSGQRVESRR